MMESKYFYPTNKSSKVFLLLGGIFITLSIVNVIFHRESIQYFIIAIGISYLTQYFLAKRWYVKIQESSIHIRNGIRIKKILYQEIINHKILVTGDLELQLEEKEIEISKDILSEADFKEVTYQLNKIKQ